MKRYRLTLEFDSLEQIRTFVELIRHTYHTDRQRFDFSTPRTTQLEEVSALSLPETVKAQV